MNAYKVVLLTFTMQFFADELLPYFHIEGEVVGFGPTELVHLKLQTGFNTYRVQPIIMKGKRVEEVFDNINAKFQAGIPLTKTDLVPLTLCTFMVGKYPKKSE